MQEAATEVLLALAPWMIPLLENPILVLQKLPLALAIMAKNYFILCQMVQNYLKHFLPKWRETVTVTILILAPWVMESRSKVF
jgi:hypothetical protein